MGQKRIAPVNSLADLKCRAKTDENYKKLLLIASHNLGGMETDNVDAAYRNLLNNAMETDEQGVVDEINGCRDFVK